MAIAIAGQTGAFTGVCPPAIRQRVFRLKIVTHRRYSMAMERESIERKILQTLDDQVRDCRQRAADCAKQAEAVVNPWERDEWLSLQGRYLALARGIERRQRDMNWLRYGPPQSRAQRHAG